jgi:hypothetical protein
MEKFRSLQKAVALGFTDFKAMESDADLNSLRNDPRYRKLVGKRGGK